MPIIQGSVLLEVFIPLSVQRLLLQNLLNSRTLSITYQIVLLLSFRIPHTIQNIFPITIISAKTCILLLSDELYIVLLQYVQRILALPEYVPITSLV